MSDINWVKCVKNINDWFVSAFWIIDEFTWAEMFDPFSVQLINPNRERDHEVIDLFTETTSL